MKKELAAVTGFKYYGPNRVIVKQYREGLALYFILTGEVEVSVTNFDPIWDCEKTEIMGTMGPGEMFGEVSLLHNIPRTATIRTLSMTTNHGFPSCSRSMNLKIIQLTAN